MIPASKSDHHRKRVSMAQIRRRVRLAVIEEAAQVAEAYDEEQFVEFKAHGSRIAKAIRALAETDGGDE